VSASERGRSKGRENRERKCGTKARVTGRRHTDTLLVVVDNILSDVVVRVVHYGVALVMLTMMSDRQQQ